MDGGSAPVGEGPEGVGARVASALQRRGLSQAQFAAMLDVKPSVLSEWIRGRTRMNVASAVRVAQALGLTLDELILGASPPEAEALTPEERLLVEMARAAGGAHAVILRLFSQATHNGGWQPAGPTTGGRAPGGDRGPEGR